MTPTTTVPPDRPSRRIGELALLALACAVDLLIWDFDAESTLLPGLPAAVVVAVDVAVFGALTLRARWPGPVFALTWGYSVAGAVVLTHYEPFIALLIALYQIARHASRRWSLVALAACLVPLGLNAYRVPSAATDVGVFVASYALFTGLAAITWTVARSWLRAEQTARLEQEMAAAAATLVLQQERLRLARELHDIVSHSVSAMMMQAAGIRAAVPIVDPRVDDTLATIESTGMRAMTELQGLLALLHGGAPLDRGAVTGSPFLVSLADLDTLLDTTRACDVEVEVVDRGEPRRLHPAVDHVAYRVVQEALTNVVKHAGRGSRVEVTMDWRATEVALGVRSWAPTGAGATGVGATALTGLGGGRGLAGLAERVGSVGGRLLAGRAEVNGYLVEVELPVVPGAEPSTPKATTPHGPGTRRATSVVPTGQGPTQSS